jgi:hypothetical protein
LNPEEHITAGLPREDALRIYTESVNKPDTLFGYNPSLPAKLDLMRGLLHDPITGDEAYALNDVIYRRRRFTGAVSAVAGLAKVIIESALFKNVNFSKT